MNSILQVVIVDDEPLARDRIRELLKSHHDVEIVGEARNGREAVEAITRQRPDIVFLDVQMPDIDGFEVLKALESNSLPLIIFVTAFDQHALRAFEFHAVDYLMKPFDRERFAKALNHAKAQLAVNNRSATYLMSLMQDLGSRKAFLERFAIKNGEKVQYIRASDVDSIEAEGNYVRLNVATSSYLIRGTLSNLESEIDPTLFVRIHRSTIINMNRVRELQTWAPGEYRVVLQGGSRHILSRSYREQFESAITKGGKVKDEG